ncbi:MAG: CRISPR-associated helicase Cas3' [spirochete symbiont of Stewartia floridana]|nr:MAG: CRISPR-associated helicase Cas3' [spirochete symbiont of Stewartia floridana]
MSTYEEFFESLTGNVPYSWQAELPTGEFRSRLIRVPTGLGKTEGVLCAWLWHVMQGHAPRRLVWCLPMRVLVRQTADVASRLLDSMPEQSRPRVFLLMGGEDARLRDLGPEEMAILVGTQDMLLSRALNRGYAASRSRWPVEFGLLNQDALWVMDETQLMDVGLATSAQMQAFREEDASKGFFPCRTWWMSATLQTDWLKSMDTRSRLEEWKKEPVAVDFEKTAASQPLMAQKSLERQEVLLDEFDRQMPDTVIEEHGCLSDGEHGRITLAVCNTVDRACKLYAKLQRKKEDGGFDLRLVHSRFRSYERERWRQFLCRDACRQGVNRIIVATQVVEAGVDISADCLITELAPWPSLVQRFGRCARYGGEGKVVVVNLGLKDKKALPYDDAELNAAWKALSNLEDVSIPCLENFENSRTPDELKALYPYRPMHLLMKNEFEELFDTAPDISGADLDVGRYIRTGEERDVMVFWREIPKKGKKEGHPDASMQARREELCPVPIGDFKKWIGNMERRRAWVWDWQDGEWLELRERRVKSLVPGRIVIVDAAMGGYSLETGFSARTKKPPVSPVVAPSEDGEIARGDRLYDDEGLSEAVWKTIATHGIEAAQEVYSMASALKLPEKETSLLALAARLHDLGKAHPAFQGSIRDVVDNSVKERSILLHRRLKREDLAKAPQEAWVAKNKLYPKADDKDRRLGLRHELASMLGLFDWMRQLNPLHPALLGSWTELLAAMDKPLPLPDAGRTPVGEIERQLLSLDPDDFDLLAYLVLSHHGKVRIAIHATPKDQEYQAKNNAEPPICGVVEGDFLPPITLGGDEASPKLTLTLEPARMGFSDVTGRSWRERTGDLLKRYGPGALALMEAVMRTADVRASQNTDPDSLIKNEEEPYGNSPA